VDSFDLHYILSGKHHTTSSKSMHNVSIVIGWQVKFWPKIIILKTKSYSCISIIVFGHCILQCSLISHFIASLIMDLSITPITPLFNYLFSLEMYKPIWDIHQTFYIKNLKCNKVFFVCDNNVNFFLSMIELEFSKYSFPFIRNSFFAIWKN